MICSSAGKSPVIDRTAWIAADATVSGDVVIGPGVRVMHGARIVAEAGGAIRIGENCIILENAVIRATGRHPVSIGNHCLFGPNCHVVGAEIADEVFVATGAAIFHGARIGRGSEIRISGVVHLRTSLEPGSTVPIGWVAVGDPATILPPDRHDDIWTMQKPLDFPGFVYGLDRDTPGIMRVITENLSRSLSVDGT